MRIVQGLASPSSYHDSYSMASVHGAPVTLDVRATPVIAGVRQLEGSWIMSRPTEMKVKMGLYPPLTEKNIEYCRSNRMLDSYQVLSQVAYDMHFMPPHGRPPSPYTALRCFRVAELEGFRDWMTGYLGKYPGAVDLSVLDWMAGKGASEALSKDNQQWLKLSGNECFYFYHSSPDQFTQALRTGGDYTMYLRFERLRDVGHWDVFRGKFNDEAVEYLKEKTGSRA